MSMNLVTLLYLIASVCFIQALKGLSNPKTARTGNAFVELHEFLTLLEAPEERCQRANVHGVREHSHEICEAKSTRRSA